MKIYGFYSKKQDCLMAAMMAPGYKWRTERIEIHLEEWAEGDQNPLWTTTEKKVAERIIERGINWDSGGGWNMPIWEEGDIEEFGQLEVVLLNTWEREVKSKGAKQ